MTLQGVAQVGSLIGATVAILNYFGIKPKSGGIVPLNRKWKLALMLGLVALSLVLSVYGFYRSLRPKIVEKVVEKQVEIPCPDGGKAPTVKPIPGAKPMKRADHMEANPIPTPKAESGSPPSQSCPNGICIGGENSGNPTVNNFAQPDRHLSPEAANALTAIAQSLTDKLAVSFITVQNGESETFADEIATVFAKQGIGYGHPPAGSGWFPSTPRGVVITCKAKGGPGCALAEKIWNALNSAGIHAVGIMLNDEMPFSNRVTIVVGEKTDGSPVGGRTGVIVMR